MMMAAMKSARVESAMVMVMRVVGNKEGKGGMGHGGSNKGGVQRIGQWQLRQE
jgi:hypothetical protein